MKTPKQLFFQQ